MVKLCVCVCVGGGGGCVRAYVHVFSCVISTMHMHSPRESHNDHGDDDGEEDEGDASRCHQSSNGVVVSTHYPWHTRTTNDIAW